VLEVNTDQVQAWSAAAIVLLTGALVGVTAWYVHRTSEMASEMKRTNQLTEENMLRLARQAAARLAFEQSQNVSVEGVNDVTSMVVRNYGRGGAHDVVLQLDGMLVELGYIGPGDATVAGLPSPFSFPQRVLDPPAKPPRYIGVDFRDDAGDFWVQEWLWGRGMLGHAILPSQAMVPE
jgi:hypothetical protein